MPKIILFVEKREILHLIKQALLNENKEDLPPVEFVNLELGKALYHSLCEMIINQFFAIKKLKTLAVHHQEVNPGAYTSPVYHLVFYKWQQEKENNTLSLLQMWADIGSNLVRGHISPTATNAQLY